MRLQIQYCLVLAIWPNIPFALRTPLSLFEQPATKFFQQHARSVVTEVPP